MEKDPVMEKGEEMAQKSSDEFPVVDQRKGDDESACKFRHSHTFS